VKKEVVSILKNVAVLLASIIFVAGVYKILNQTPPRITEVPYFRIEVWEVRGKWMY